MTEKVYEFSKLQMNQMLLRLVNSSDLLVNLAFKLPEEREEILAIKEMVHAVEYLLNGYNPDGSFRD